MAVARMRTVDGAFKYIQGQDPETALTKSAFYRFVREGKIPHCYVGFTGKKKLINLDDVDEFLSNGFKNMQEEPKQIGIRAINEKILPISV
ncbi:MAG: hypothetical protein VB018_13155 [Lachnospiraceae bacterium]|nr:hypothetical protein [Lachnospiraceae bacterium]